jgi:hypothetical protein
MGDVLESSQDRLKAIVLLIRSYQQEIMQLESEASKLESGDISLRSLGFDKALLYPLWRKHLMTVGDIKAYIDKHGSLKDIRRLGPKKIARLMDAITK